MSSCPSCGVKLAGDWRFCLQCGHRLVADVPAALRSDQPPASPGLSPLAVVALVLGIIGGPIAAVFGHLAMGQIRRTGQRGMLIARIATVLGYLWLVIWIVVIVWIVVAGVR